MSRLPGAGMLRGLGVTMRTMLRRTTTQQFPHERPDLPARTRGVIGLMEENCTVCMLCAEECPDWCIYIDSHREQVPPEREGGRERTRQVLDRFAIDFALCMYCGICIEVCPFDALFWSPEFAYATFDIRELTHERDRLRAWMDTVPEPPSLEEGAEPPKEVADAIAAARERAEEARREQEQQEAGEQEGEPFDRETYERLVAEGASERVARSKAKAAAVRARKRAEREAGGPAETAAGEGAGAAAGGGHQQAEQDEPFDRETYERLVAEGASERVARSKAKAAAIRARKRAEREGE